MLLIEKLNDAEVEFQGNNFRVLWPIRIGERGHWLSIQASSSHYNTPRHLLPFEDYTHMEIIVNVPDIDIPNGWDEYIVGENHYAYVPVGDINNLLIKLIEKYGGSYE